MVKEKLLSWDYYEKKIPLYLKQSNSFAYHFKMLVDLFNTLNDGYDTLFKYIDILGTDPLLNSDVLDKIGALYGITRDVHIHYEVDGGVVDKDLTLKDEDFLTYITLIILRNNFNGTFGDIYKTYKKFNLPFYMLTTGDAEVTVYIDSYSGINIATELMLSGLVTLESMGISYRYLAINIGNLATFDTEGKTYDSENAVWGL